jgi:hypothetical protein
MSTAERDVIPQWNIRLLNYWQPYALRTGYSKQAVAVTISFMLGPLVET